MAYARMRLICFVLLLGGAFSAGCGEERGSTQPWRHPPSGSTTGRPAPTLPVPAAVDADASAGSEDSDASAPDAPAETAGRRHVVVISIDGCRPDALAAASASRLIAFGAAGTIAAQAFTIPLSLTLPSHSSMLSGYDMEHHGVNWNAALPELGYIKVPTIFAVAHAAGLRTVMIMGKGKFLTLELPDTLDEVHEVGFDDDGITDTAIYVINKGNFDLMFIHLPNPDLTGHAKGWMSPDYLAKVVHADQLFGRITAALPADATVIVTADHGGHDFGHGADVDIDRHIPWMIKGPGIRKGVVVDRPIATMDTGATALKLLGLQLGPDAQGRPVDEAFAP
jgi:arylsulfatase A-like enzyme